MTLVSFAEWMVVDYLHQKSGQDRNKNKFRVTLKDGGRKYHCCLCFCRSTLYSSHAGKIMSSEHYLNVLSSVCPGGGLSEFFRDSVS